MLSLYRAVNALVFGYKIRSLSTACGGYRCLVIHTKHINALCENV